MVNLWINLSPNIETSISRCKPQKDYFALVVRYVDSVYVMFYERIFKKDYLLS